MNRLENIGADLNAYTTKEYTCIHASFLHPFLDRSLELFQDIIFHSTFPEEEMEKEKGIILDEIASYIDQPEEAINDDFEDVIFKNHALGNNILGTAASVAPLNKADILDFMQQNYQTDEIVIGVFGDYTLAKVVKIVEKYYAAIPANPTPKKRTPPSPLAPEKIEIVKPISQSHVVLGNTAYHMHHPDKLALLLLNNYLGGIGMSAKLNLEIREKHGIAYTIESNYIPFTDTGLFCIYFGTDAEKVKKATQLIHKELHILCNQGLTDTQLKISKQKFIGQIALGEENRMGLIISMAKSLIDYQKIDSLEQIFEKINAISSPQILRVSQEIFNPEGLSSLTFSPQ